MDASTPVVHVIKKYPNRRLYDTNDSRYITLQDIRDLVKSEIPFRVIDSKTQADITHATLLQIIAEQEEQQSSFLSVDLLKEMIRLYGDPQHGLMGPVVGPIIARSLAFFQEKMVQAPPPFSPFSPPSPIDWMQWVNQQQTQFWEHVRQNPEPPVTPPSPFDKKQETS